MFCSNWLYRFGHVIFLALDGVSLRRAHVRVTQNLLNHYHAHFETTRGSAHRGQASSNPVSGEMPFLSSPRHCGQSAAPADITTQPASSTPANLNRTMCDLLGAYDVTVLGLDVDMKM
jgi:hypothetical protein